MAKKTRSTEDYVRRWHSECNGYCRGGRHAGVVFCEEPDQATVEDLARTFVENILGGRFVACQSAPEAKNSARRVDIFPHTGAVERNLAPLTVGYLVVWESDDLTRDLGA